MTISNKWDNTGSYPIILVNIYIYPIQDFFLLFLSMLDKMEDDGNAFDGVAFHCYAGLVLNQDAFHNAFPFTVSYLQILPNNMVFF